MQLMTKAQTDSTMQRDFAQLKVHSCVFGILASLPSTRALRPCPHDTVDCHHHTHHMPGYILLCTVHQLVHSHRHH